MRVCFDNKCIIGGGGGECQKRLHVLAGGGKKSYPSSLRGVQKVPNVPFPHLPAPPPLPINNEHSLTPPILWVQIVQSYSCLFQTPFRFNCLIKNKTYSPIKERYANEI